MPTSKVSRRKVLGYAASGVALPYLIPSGVLASPGKPGANDRVVIGFIGTGHRANQLMDQVPAGGKIVAIADCFLKRAQETVAAKKTDWKIYQDYRKMLDEQQLDAVMIATPDHVRTRIAIHACQAGKDVYAEKPLTAYIGEGRALVNAARKYNRVFQVGSQQRTMEVNRVACEFVRNGGLGKIQKVLGINYTGPQRYSGLPREQVPAGDDWDVWCGPTELRPFNSQLQFSWMRWRDYSGGEMTNWGAHGLDQIQWALGASETGPVEIWPVSPGPNGKVSLKYASGVVVSLELDKGPQGGGIFIGERGKIEINRNKFTTNPPGLIKDAPTAAKAEAWEGPGWIAKPHIQNWLDCIRSREKPNADVEIGHRSISVSHLANIAREIGRKLRWNPDKERFVDDPEADKYLNRPRRKGYELPEA
ncbi:MAG TPA: Gfo/Idh/MocA family oxidoreductase [Pirellulales bacterium]|jgi:predicted dehydrogenase|nr:Gfo/Idh/MocA family oxidoreductase [Pirellulales bacterium]